MSAENLVAAAQVWGLIGALVVVPFLTFGIDRFDADARGAYVFRVLLVPALLLIWPPRW
jgi:uncharacterized membrane protein YjgN (DUF898 family)